MASGGVIVREEVLKAHNDYRKTHAASTLQWDATLADWASKCAEECSKKKIMVHCKHKQVEGAPYDMGQNIYMYKGPFPANAVRAVDTWYEEVHMHNFRKDAPQKNTGHFTQVVWKGTTKVGMARSKCGEFIVANYSPAGNVIGQYKINVLKGEFSGEGCCCLCQ